MNTLSQYKVKWTHVNVGKMLPETDLDHLIIEEMCVQASKGIELQCKHEYWGEESGGRTTELHKLTLEERQNLPTNNLNAERYLATFGYLASQSAQHSNKLFKAKRIKDDLILSDSKKDVIKAEGRVLKTLEEMEITWTEKQIEIKKARLKKNLKKKVRAKDFVDQILQKCKSLGGPLTSAKEVNLLQKKIHHS